MAHKVKIYDYADREVHAPFSIINMGNRKLKKLKRKGYCFHDIPDVKLSRTIVRYTILNYTSVITYIHHKTEIDGKILKDLEKYGCDFYFNINTRCCDLKIDNEIFYDDLRPPKLEKCLILDDDCFNFNKIKEDGRLFCIFKNKKELAKFKLKF